MEVAPFYVRASVLQDFRQFALTLGLDPIGLMARAGISRYYLQDPDLRMPMRGLVDLLELGAKASGLPDFGVRFGEARGLPDLGPMVLMMREEPDLRTALTNFAGLFHLHSDAMVLFLDEQGPEPIWIFDILGHNIGSRRQAIDAGLVGALWMMRWMLGMDWDPQLVCFRHERPTSTLKHEQFFRCPLQFSAEVNGIVLHRSDFNRSLRASSAGVKRQVERIVTTFAQSLSEPYATNVSRVVASLLSHGDATASNTARLLGVSTRSLHRKLADDDANFSMILDQVRRDRVAQQMGNRHQSLTEIASQLGFGSLSAFSRWFSQTYNCSPSRARAAQEPRAFTTDERL